MTSAPYRWPNDARLALSLVVNVEEGTARSIVDGDPVPEPASHGYRSVHQFRMDEEAGRAFLRRAADSIERTVGARPAGHDDVWTTTRRSIAEHFAAVPAP